MSSPAQSPRDPEPEEAEQGGTSEVENENQQPSENQNEDMSRDDPGLGYDFEVKEQDRWLPIANGKFSTLLHPSRFSRNTRSRVPGAVLVRLSLLHSHLHGVKNNGDWRRVLSTYTAANALHCSTNRNSSFQAHHLQCPRLALVGRITDMNPSPSPPSSPPPASPSPQLSKAGAAAAAARERFDSDANIHNFAPVARIMKTALPENAKIAKEAKECMQECVSEFISFITSEGT